MNTRTDEEVAAALELAATQAEHWPSGYGRYRGKTLEGEWTTNPYSVADYRCPALVLSRRLGADPEIVLNALCDWFSRHRSGEYAGLLDADPRIIAQGLREIDPAIFNGLLERMGSIREW